MYYTYEEFLFNDFPINIYQHGDFSFIHNQFYRNILTCDYIIFDTYNLWRRLEEKIDHNDIFWKNIKYFLYENHTDKTLENSISFLRHIHLHGWTDFVIKYLNDYYLRKHLGNIK